MTACSQYYSITFFFSPPLLLPPVVKYRDWSPIDLATLRECRYLEARSCTHGGVQQQILNCFCTAIACVTLYSSKLRAACAQTGGEKFCLFKKGKKGGGRKSSDCVLTANHYFDALPSWPLCQLRFSLGGVRVSDFCLSLAFSCCSLFFKEEEKDKLCHPLPSCCSRWVD